MIDRPGSAPDEGLDADIARYESMSEEEIDADCATPALIRSRPSTQSENSFEGNLLKPETRSDSFGRNRLSRLTYWKGTTTRT
jgi:hypothetical protein